MGTLMNLSIASHQLERTNSGLRCLMTHEMQRAYTILLARMGLMDKLGKK